MPQNQTTSWLAPDGRLRRLLRKLPQGAVDSGLPPRWLGYRWVARETVPEYFRRRGSADSRRVPTRPGESYRSLHPETIAVNPLPRNVASREELPADRGWWGFSFHDVPARRSGETFLATLADCRLAFYRDGANGGGDFHVGILDADDRALSLREVAFRPGHARMLRAATPPVRVARATWILERSYHNFSHWLTAHLTKLYLLRELDALDGVVLPRARSGFVESSLRLLDIPTAELATFDPTRPLHVGELTLVGIDRFRPEPLRGLRSAMAKPARGGGGRRIFVSRARSTRRRLVDEDGVWARFRAAGFERVVLEDLPFEEQVRLMGETEVLCGPHGAGLTNMIFCRAGTQVVEIADPGFPNPNFYALACAMSHDYWIVRARSVGEGHPLERDMRVPEEHVTAVLAALE